MAGIDHEKHEKVVHNDHGQKGTLEESDEILGHLGYVPELHRNRSLLTLLFQSLSIAAIPFGESTAMMVAIFGGGQLSIFVGWIVVCSLDQCVAMSLAEFASRYPTSAGPYYWSFQLAKSHAKLLSFVTAWIWMIGNWTITLSVNFALAELLVATVSIYKSNWTANAWQLLLVFYAICIVSFFICGFGNRFLPMVDTICAAWTLASVIILLIALSVTAESGRHDASFALGNYDDSLSGWGGFSFFIGLLPPSFVFSAVGMISAMAEEVDAPAVKLPRAMALCIPVGGILGLFYVVPLCVTLPGLIGITHAPGGQAIPYAFQKIMGTRAGAVGLIVPILGIGFFCSLSITNAASRCTWALARDKAIPWSRMFSRVDDRTQIPFWALGLVTVVQMLLGLINLGSTSAFTAFISVGVVALAITYAIPISISLFYNKRHEVSLAKWNCGKVVGPIVNVLALVWIGLELVLFDMPVTLPVTSVSMNYASVVLVGFVLLSWAWYFIHARKGMSMLTKLLCLPLTDSLQYMKAHLYPTQFSKILDYFIWVSRENLHPSPSNQT